MEYPDPANSYFVSLNTRSPRLQRRDIRQALNYAINRDGIVALFNGQALPLGMPVPRGSEVAGDGAAVSYDFEPEKAKRLLAQSGVALPLTVKFLAPSSGPGFGLATSVVALMQQDLQRVGIDLQASFVEFATMMSTVSGGYKDDIDGVLNGWDHGCRQRLLGLSECSARPSSRLTVSTAAGIAMPTSTRYSRRPGPNPTTQHAYDSIARLPI